MWCSNFLVCQHDFPAKRSCYCYCESYQKILTCDIALDFTFAGLSIDEFSRKKMDATAEELSEEKALAYSCLS